MALVESFSLITNMKVLDLLFIRISYLALTGLLDSPEVPILIHLSLIL